MIKSDATNELAGALAKAQGEMKPAVMNQKNPFFKNNYADLQSVWDSIRGPFAKNGLSVVQTVGIDEKGMVLETSILHSSGQWISSALRLTPVKQDPQGVGSAITYARRYALSAIAGVCSDEDDDANHAAGKTKHKEPASDFPPPADTNEDLPNFDSLPEGPKMPGDEQMEFGVHKGKWFSELLNSKPHIIYCQDRVAKLGVVKAGQCSKFLDFAKKNGVQL